MKADTCRQTENVMQTWQAHENAQKSSLKIIKKTYKGGGAGSIPDGVIGIFH